MEVGKRAKKSCPRTPEQFEKHMLALIEEFEQNIAYSKENACFLIRKDSFHNYSLEKMH